MMPLTAASTKDVVPWPFQLFQIWNFIFHLVGANCGVLRIEEATTSNATVTHRGRLWTWRQAPFSTAIFSFSLLFIIVLTQLSITI